MTFLFVHKKKYSSLPVLSRSLPFFKHSNLAKKNLIILGLVKKPIIVILSQLAVSLIILILIKIF